MIVYLDKIMRTDRWSIIGNHKQREMVQETWVERPMRVFAAKAPRRNRESRFTLSLTAQGYTLMTSAIEGCPP
jgi:hypothetical protein